MTFYKNNGHISRYPQTERIQNVISLSQHAELRDDMPKYARKYSGDIFADVGAILQTIPIAALNHFGENENCEYADVAYNAKNIYLSIVTTTGVEDIAYSFNIKDNSTNVFSSVNVLEASENVYGSSYIISSYNVFFSENIINSNNIWMSNNCIGCTECLYCDGLENMSYCIDNKQSTREDYQQQKEILLAKKDTYTKRQTTQMVNMGSSNVTWSNLYNCHDGENMYYCSNLQNARNAVFISSNEENSDFYDVFMWGRSTNFYGVCDAGGFSDNCYCITQCATCTDMYYSLFCEWCSFCLGCVGLKNKQFCILNQQYTKEERHQKVDEIFGHMEKNGTLGEFFPWSMNPFYFNDTAAHMIMWSEQSEPGSTAGQAFTKQEVTALWYLRRDEPVKVDIPVGAEIIKTGELWDYEWYSSHPERSEGSSKDNLDSSIVSLSQNDKKWTINPDILKKIIIDEQWNYYRIVQMEYDFLIKHWLPLPRKHRLERMKENFRIT